MSKKEKTTISEKILSVPFFVLFMMIVNTRVRHQMT